MSCYKIAVLKKFSVKILVLNCGLFHMFTIWPKRTEQFGFESLKIQSLLPNRYANIKKNVTI